MRFRKVIAALSAVAVLFGSLTSFAASFSDLPDTHKNKSAIDQLVALGVINGYTDGTFKPENEITRAEVTKMVVAAMGPSYTAAAESALASTGFSDVDSVNHWAAGYIATGVSQGFINGMGDGTFSPDTNVTFAQIVKMLVAILGYTPAAEGNGGYPNGYIQTGSSIGLTEGVAGLSHDTPVTRAQVAQLIANAVSTPVVAVTKWTTDIFGKPVAETEIKDGKGDSREYATLLTENHNVYKVRGRVTATHAQGGIERGTVDYQIEYSDNYDGESYNMRKNGDYDKLIINAEFGDTKAEEYLFTYSEALILIDDDDEETIISITPYGNNSIVELYADDYEEMSAAGALNKTIDFLTSATSSKTKTYKLDDDVEVYVNGVESKYSFHDSVIKYISGNSIGKVTLIDTPKDGSTSKDGKYDYIMVTVKKWAVVDSVFSSSYEDKIYFDEFENGVGSSITIDNEDEDFVVNYIMDGEEAEFDYIEEKHVLLISYDVVNCSRASDSDFLTIEISDEVLEEQVMGRTQDNGIKYYVDGKYYRTVADISGDLEVGNYYTMYLDAAGRIVKVDETISSKNYAVIDRVYYDNNEGDYKIRIIKADGTRVSYFAKDEATRKLASRIAYGNEGYLDGMYVAADSVENSYVTDGIFEVSRAVASASKPNMVTGGVISSIFADSVLKATATPTPTPTPTVTPVAGNRVWSIYNFNDMFNTSKATVKPTATPTPTVVPTPVATPAVVPVVTPEIIPVVIPTTAPVEATATPTAMPTVAPTTEPTVAPTPVVTVAPEIIPVVVPTVAPVVIPMEATIAPTTEPTIIPTIIPTIEPVVIPTLAPTVANPTVEPMEVSPAPSTETAPPTSATPSAPSTETAPPTSATPSAPSTETAPPTSATPSAPSTETAPPTPTPSAPVSTENPGGEGPQPTLVTLTALAGRVISYKINSRDEIHTIKQLSTTSETDEYNENTEKVGSVRMTESTQIVDLTDVVESGGSYSLSDIKAASLSSFVDGEEYSVLGADKGSDGKYRFVIITEGNSAIGVNTRFAVIDSVGSSVYAGDIRTSVTLYSADGRGDKETLYLDEDISFSADRGTVVAYGVDGDGIITDIRTLFDELNPNANRMSYSEAASYFMGKTKINDPKGRLDDYYLKSNIAKWDNSDLVTSNGYARIGFGAIVDKNGSSVTIATINKAIGDTVVANGGVTIPSGDYYSDNDDMGEFSLDYDVNVYVYDYNYKNSSTSGRISVGSKGSIVKTSVSKTLLEDDNKGNPVYNWSEIEDERVYANFAFFKVVDGDITDILVIIPKD